MTAIGQRVVIVGDSCAGKSTLIRSYRRWRARELLWGTNRERFFHQFVLWDKHRSLIAWNLDHRRKLHRRYTDAMRDPANRHLTFHHLVSPSELREFLDRLEPERATRWPTDSS